MKFRNVKFLANANIKGNQKSNTILVLMILLLVSLTLISSFSLTITNGLNVYKNDVRARMLEIDPWTKDLSDEVIESIENIDHVESVDMLKGMRNQVFDILNVSENNNSDEQLMKQIKDRDGCSYVWSLIGSEKMDVIAGKSLDETPTFSCIVPSLFYPFEYENTEEDLDYIDGETLIGKTITVKTGENFEELYNYRGSGSECGGNEWVYLPSLEYKLNVVGVYYSSPTGKGYYDSIYVSEETGLQIEQMAFDASGIDMTDNSLPAVKWWNTPALRTHYVTVDDVDNIDYVYNKLSEMNVESVDTSELGINPSIPIIANLFSIGGIILVFATLLLCIINLIQSTTSSLQSRKGEIGLLKAIGYKNKQIFSCLYLEQLSLTIKGCVIGAIISAVCIAISNLIFSHSTYVNRLYIVNWSYYFTFLAISVAVAVIVPLICQLLTLHKLNKIQPKDAMNDE